MVLHACHYHAWLFEYVAQMKRPRNYSETKLQIKVVEWLQQACPFLLFTHPANQGRSLQEGAKLKRMGVLAGTPDLLFWHNGWFGAIELKTTSGLSDPQKKFRDKFIASGGKYATCKSVADVYETLRRWDVKPYAHQIKEPSPPKHEQYKAAMEFFKP